MSFKNCTLLCIYGYASKDDFHKRGQCPSLSCLGCFLSDNAVSDFFSSGCSIRMGVVNGVFLLPFRLIQTSFGWTLQTRVSRVKLIIHFSSLPFICSAHLSLRAIEASVTEENTTENLRVHFHPKQGFLSKGLRPDSAIIPVFPVNTYLRSC